MRPLVRAYIKATEGMHPYIDEAVQLYERRGWMDPVAMVKSIPWEDQWETPLREAWELSAARVMRRAWSGATKAIRKDLETEAVLSAKEQESLLWLEDHGAVLAKQLTKANRKAIRAVLEQAIKEGWGMRKTAAAIKPSIGLLPTQNKAVSNRRKKLEAQEWKPDRIQSHVERYAKKLLKQRAENIARTETIRAMNVGQMEAWKQLQRDGFLPDDVKHKWIVAGDERMCEFCMELGDSEPVPLKEGWESSEYGNVKHPPLHPSCRCSTGIV
jgi:hypothetical protein